ncbi:MAG: helix-turn-helix domain-containing protein [Rhodobacteraceae bacterium]|nr:helix-turn-helix domain-containing protein [Paracoccaceae bacterium]
MTQEPSVEELQGFDSFELRLGDELRGERATLGKSLLDVQRDLRIKAAYIAAIENCDLSVFENTGFLAGYVRSYARYLELDAEATYARFCLEANFQGAHADLGRRREGHKKAPVAAISASELGKNLSPGLAGVAMRNGSAGINLAGFGPLFVMIALIAGIGYGGWTLLKDIQRVDIAPIERSPVVLDTIDSGEFAAGLNIDAMDRVSERANDLTLLYSRQLLEVPIVTPRDGPIADIDPSAFGSFEMVATAAPETVLPETVVAVGEPQLTAQIHEPIISIFAQQEAWVRVTADDGSILFETILDAGQEYTLKSGTELATLRAGNAGNVFLLVDGQVFGPLNGNNGVVNGLSLAAADIENSFEALGTMTAEMREVSEQQIRAASLASE